MGSRGSYLRERIADYRSRLNLRDRKTQLAVASGVTAIAIIVAAVLALPGSGDKAGPGRSGDRAVGSISELAEQAAEDPPPLLGGATGRSGGKVSSPTAQEGGGGGAPSDPPITDTEIKVGITYTSDPGGANAAAGFGGIGQVDQRRGWEAMIADINRDPPLGRKVVPVWFSQTEREIISKGTARIEQEACQYFTKDNPVFLVWDGSLVGAGDTFNQCATDARIPEIGGGGGLSYSETYKKYPYNVEPAAVALDRMAAFHTDKLFDGGFFSTFKDQEAGYTPVKPVDGKPIVGLLRYDQPSYKAGAARLKERLAAHGLSMCPECEVEVTYSSSDVQEQLNDATEVQAAIQTFKAKNVTHLIMLGSTAGCRLSLFFADGAEKQNYRPRLGLNPLDCADTVRNTLGSSSYPQWQQSMLVTWNPRQFGIETDAYKRCKKLFEDAGETFGGNDVSRNKDAQISFYCDPAFYFAATLRTVGRDLTVDTWMNGVATVPPVPSASTYLMQTKANRHDGTGAIRIGEWFDDCSCWKPTSDILPV